MDWNEFWNSMNSDQRQLFRMLQRAHRQLGIHSNMFSADHIGMKIEIHEYVLDKFNVDLNDLPKCDPVPVK